MAVNINEKYTRDVVRDVYNDIKIELLSSNPVIDTILAQILSEQGKGIRPRFMALVAELVDGSWEDVRQAAMVIEAIHLSSLLHDDVVDSSELRHGVPTVNTCHSDKVSVLFGDHIFVDALIIANKIDNPEVSNVILQALRRMVRGEILDTLASEVIDEDTYLRIISDKTASLFAASGELGVLLSGGNDIEREWANELGENLGRAFQIIDDTLDYNGSPEEMGKPVFMDVMHGNMTLPLIYSLKDKTYEEKQEILDVNNGSVDWLTQIVHENGGIEYAYRRATDYLEKARDILSRFGNKELHPVFHTFFDQLINRHF